MPSCFVIMPFGEKTDAENKPINFDKIYKFLIKPSVEQIKGLTCIRCDEIEEPGVVHKKMLEHIYQADVAVVDITTLNPNVFYELGVRHALAERVTVMIKRSGTKIPFNIQGLQTIEYDPTDLESVDETKNNIVKFIQNGLKSRKIDSLVHESLPIRIAPDPTPLKKTVRMKYALTASKHVGIITGDLLNVKGVDVWVSSENTNMQMARFFEKSISGAIRYHGAKKNQSGQVIDDLLAKELAAIVGEYANVPAAKVIATSAGELEARNGVKRLFHAAAVHGQIGEGFMPIKNIHACVRNALTLADTDERGANFRSILFPLMGTGQGGGKLQETVQLLIGEAISYLEDNPDSVIQEAYFICWTEQELEACQWVFEQAGLTPAPG